MPEPRLQRGAHLFSDSNLDAIAHVLDDLLRIPGTSIRFGLSGIVGLVPAVGDVLGAMAGWIFLLAAWVRGVPRVTLARMFANIALETILGTVPLLGDAFAIAWKANRRNFRLLQAATAIWTPEQLRRRRQRDWSFLVILVLCMMVLLAVPIALLIWLLELAVHHMPR